MSSGGNKMSDFMDKAKIFFGFETEVECRDSRRISSVKAAEKNNVVRMSAVKRKAMQSEVRVFEPRDFNESVVISKYLRENCPVIVNLKYIDATTAKRLVDFICGATYAIDGNVLKLGENIFLFTPQEVAIVEGDEDIEEKEHSIDENVSPMMRLNA